jgi:transposase
MWSADGTWERILQAVQADADTGGRIDWSLVGVDSTVCRAHEHAAGAREKAPRKPGKRTRPAQHRPDEALGRSRGGLSTNIHRAGDGGLRPLALLVTPGQWGDAPQLIPFLERVRIPRPAGGRPRTRPDHLSGDKAYSSRRDRRYLRRRQIGQTIPEPENQPANRQRRGSAGGRPTGFDAAQYTRRNEVERLINKLKIKRAVAMRFDKRAYVFHGTVTLGAIRLWLR